MSGKLVIFSAPSGAGKTTLVQALLKQDIGLEFSISACSRDKRENEIHGKDYYFLGVDGFKEKIAANAFLEWEEVYKNNFYGTLKSEVDRIWAQGKDVIFDVDVYGGINIKKQFKEKALAIFVMPPSVAILEERLRKRSTDDEDSIRRRLDKALNEIDKAAAFDIIIVNDQLDEAIAKASDVVMEFLHEQN